MKPIQELIRASDHLHYEIWMLRLTAYLVTGLPTGSSSASEDSGPSGADLHAFTHTTHFEVSLYSSNAPYSPPSEPENDAVLGNATLEAFAIHLRSLLDFFYLDAKKAWADDVLAEHYFSDPDEWRTVRPELPQTKIDEIKARVATEVAHLTYERNHIAEIEWNWPILEYKRVVLAALDAFLRRVDSAKLSDRWQHYSA